MGQINTLLKVASSYLGVAEDPRGSNNVIFNTDYYGHPVSGSSYPWCMVFVWDCFRLAGLSALFYGGGKTASCTALMNWAKRKGQWVTEGYRTGDVVLFQFDEDDRADHVGICERVDPGKLYCIEGNTNDEVRHVSRSLSCVMGAWRPAYDDEPEAGCVVELPELKKGSTGRTVWVMQSLLIVWGYDLPQYGADADFGGETEAAVKRFQRGASLDADGIVGVLTWKELLGVN